jgi:Domain of unknown function (DUF4157)/Novel toxin 16
VGEEFPSDHAEQRFSSTKGGVTVRTFAERPNTTQQARSPETTMPGRAQFGPSREVQSIPHLQRTIGTQAMQRMWQNHAEKPIAGLTEMASPRFGHDFSRVHIHSRAAGALQTKLAINKPGDQYEQEADRISEQVMRMEAPDIGHTAPLAIQRLCPECEEEAPQRKSARTGAGVDTDQVQRGAGTKVDAVSGGQPLTHAQRAFFEPRFGADFSRVRIHADSSADAAARAVGAHAYTLGSDIVFRGDHYHPHTFAGRQLLAHELTHVVQQGAGPRIQRLPVNENGEGHLQISELHIGVANHMVQRWPGDGMLPPGDCGWATYLVLRGSVETAKAVVSTLGACTPGDNCLTLAAKIAAITAEIAARVALDGTCFKGGDTGHRQQVQDKINMMNRCYRFFSNSNCPPELIAAMAVVVDRAREVIAAAAVAVAVGLAVALIAAIIALADVIAALAAAAAAATAEAAAAAAAAAAVIALLVLIKDQLSPKDSSGA